MGGHRRMPSLNDEVKQLTKELNLTDTQKTQVKTILQDQRDQMKSFGGLFRIPRGTTGIHHAASGHYDPRYIRLQEHALSRPEAIIVLCIA